MPDVVNEPLVPLPAEPQMPLVITGRVPPGAPIVLPNGLVPLAPDADVPMTFAERRAWAKHYAANRRALAERRAAEEQGAFTGYVYVPIR